MTQLPSGLSTRPETFAPASESNLRLQRAVESLNLNLDDELHRYRQARSGQATPAPARLQLRTQRKPIDLIAVKSTATAATASAPPPPPNPRLQEILGQVSAPSGQIYPPQATVHQVRMSHGGTLTTYRPAPDEYLESTEALLGSVPTAAYHRREPEYASSPLRQLTTPLGMGALLLLLVTSAGFGYLVTSPQAIQHLSDNAITRRLKGEPTATDNSADSVALDSLESQGEADFRPLGPDLSEKEFASLDLNNISTLPSANSPNPPAAAAAGTTAPAMVGGQPLPTAAQRPGEPRTTGPRPGVLTPAGGSGAVVQAEIVTAPRAAASSRPAAIAAAPTRSAPAPVTAPPAVRATPPTTNAQPPRPLAAAPTAPSAPAAPAAVAPPAPITQAPPQASAPSYYVVTDYNGTQSLDSARSAVGDAYVRNFSSGTRIQMGAFSQESSAQNLVNQLQGQGIPAQVISP